MRMVVPVVVGHSMVHIGVRITFLGIADPHSPQRMLYVGKGIPHSVETYKKFTQSLRMDSVFCGIMVSKASDSQHGENRSTYRDRFVSFVGSSVGMSSALLLRGPLVQVQSDEQAL